MNFFCKLLGHTWVHRTQDPKVSWNTGKSLSELHQTVDGEFKLFLECQRCGERNDSPTKDEIRRANN